jgi:transposase
MCTWVPFAHAAQRLHSPALRARTAIYLAADAAALARRFRDHEATILRFVADFAVPFTNKQAERDVRPIKLQQRSSGGAWRTLAGLADFAIVQSYIATAAKWGIDTLDALERLFTTRPWLPPSTQPS